jgi:hypothetical protein
VVEEVVEMLTSCEVGEAATTDGSHGDSYRNDDFVGMEDDAIFKASANSGSSVSSIAPSMELAEVVPLLNSLGGERCSTCKFASQFRCSKSRVLALEITPSIL